MKTLFAGILLLLCLGAALFPEPNSQAGGEPVLPAALLHPLEKLYSIIQQNDFYADQTNDEKFTQAVLTAVVRSLHDDFASLVKINNRGPYHSTTARNTDLGLILDTDPYGRLQVASILPGSPADDNGIEAGDLLLLVNNQQVSFMSPGEALAVLAGPVNSQVRLTLQGPKSVPREIAVQRTKFDFNSVTIRIGDLRFGRWRDMANGRTALIKVSSYVSPVTIDQWNSAIEEIRSNDSVREIVLDLRDNGGGDNACLITLGDFFRSGELIVKFQSAYDSDDLSFQEVHNYWTPRARLMTYPAVVLINENTASLAEIAAAALRDGRNVPLVGERSYGKGTTQTWVSIGSSFIAHISSGRWYSPKGTSVNGIGIEPDLIIEDNPFTRRDEQLDAAVRLIQQR